MTTRRSAPPGPLASLSALVAVLALAGPGPVRAQQGGATAIPQAASAWSPAPLSRLRLLDAGEDTRPDDADGRRLAAIEIALVPGAKTYWRDPGEAGLAPRFDWSGSENLARVEARWPAPRQFDEGGARAVGYARDLVLPLVVTPKEAGRPVLLVLAADYGACAAQCVPSRGAARLALPAVARPSPHRARVLAALALVPAADGVGAGAPSAVSVLGAALEGGALMVGARRRCDAPLEAVAEGPEGWSFGPAAAPPCDDPSAPARLALPVRARPPEAVGAALTVTITLVEGPAAVERSLTLDAAPPAP